MNVLLAVLAAVVVGTWNGNWFPSGRAKHRAHPDVEAATIAASAKMLAGGLARIDPEGTNDVILCLNEIRNRAVATNLIAQIGREGLQVVSVSAYRWSDRFDEQQDVIATTLPCAAANWSKWRQCGNTTPPRGYAFAAVVIEPAVTAHVYAVHLKSNYRATTPDMRESNRMKRAHAIEQIVSQEKPSRARKHRVCRPVIVAGDMNADRWSEDFAEEKIFIRLEKAGFSNLLAELPEGARGTHLSKSYGDSALDYVFVRELSSVSSPLLVPNEGLSDHCALFTLVK